MVTGLEAAAGTLELVPAPNRPDLLAPAVEGDDDAPAPALAQDLQRALAGAGPAGLEAVGAQRVLQRVGDAGFVFDDEDAGFGRRRHGAGLSGDAG